MCDDREHLVKRTKGSFANYSKSTEQQNLETLSTTKLLDLNDDCLDHFFNHLNLIELGSLTQVCTRLKHLAELYFKRKYSEFDFSTLFADRLASHHEARSILSNFGPMIKSLTISRHGFSNHKTIGHVEQNLLKDIVEFCGEKLLTLSMKNFYFTSHAVVSLNMLSGSLESLSLLGCVSDLKCGFHLSNFFSLKELTVTNTPDCFILLSLFPKLDYLRLDMVSIPIRSVLQHFIANHKQLTTLRMGFCKGISSDVIRTIGENLENLKILCFGGNLIEEYEPIEYVQNNVLHLSELKNLQTLTWYGCNFLSIGKLLAKMVANDTAMQILTISNSIVDDELIEAIVKMKKLQNLTFIRTDGLKDEHVIKIAKEVTQLRELCIDTQKHRYIKFDVLKKVLGHAKQLKELCLRLEKLRLDHTWYNDVLGIVKGRGNGIKLTIKVSSTNVEVLIPQLTMNMNKNWLIIEHGVYNMFNQQIY